MPCASGVGRERMERGEAGQSGGPLVDLGVVLHRARAERVEARVDRVVELRQVDEVADDLGLVELGQADRRRAPVRLRDAVERVGRWVRDLGRATTRARQLRERRLEHRHRLPAGGPGRPSPPGSSACGSSVAVTRAPRAARSRSRSMSSSVVTSVAQTSSASRERRVVGVPVRERQAREHAAVEERARGRLRRRARGPRTR